MVEGIWLHATTPCDFMSIDELRQRLQAGDRVFWQGEIYAESEVLLPCTCEAGYLLQPTVQQKPEEDNHLWPPTQRVQERLASNIERWRTQEAELSQRLAAGGDLATERKLREHLASLQEMRERYERVLAWIPTAPDLSNSLVMTASLVKWDEQDARPQRRRPLLFAWFAMIRVVAFVLARFRRRK